MSRWSFGPNFEMKALSCISALVASESGFLATLIAFHPRHGAEHAKPTPKESIQAVGESGTLRVLTVSQSHLPPKELAMTTATTAPPTTGLILAIDLSKYKSVACRTINRFALEGSAAIARSPASLRLFRCSLPPLQLLPPLRRLVLLLHRLVELHQPLDRLP